MLSFLYGQEELGLVDIVSSDPDGALTVANYVHAIHLEVRVCMEAMFVWRCLGVMPQGVFDLRV